MRRQGSNIRITESASSVCITSGILNKKCSRFGSSKFISTTTEGGEFLLFGKRGAHGLLMRPPLNRGFEPAQNNRSSLV